MTKTLTVGCFALGVLALALLVCIPGTQAQTVPPAVSEAVFEMGSFADADSEELTAAVMAALAEAGPPWTAVDYEIDHIQYQADETMASVWLAAYDPQTGDLLAREPELTVAVLEADGAWRVYLRDDPDFGAVYEALQAEMKGLLDDSALVGDKTSRDDVVYGGYYLPWAATLEKRLTWSVGHTSCTPIYYCTHAFDFADGTMFPLLASKGGTVYHWDDSCPNGSTSCTNSITLQDRSTTPWTYQIYIHLAYDSIPEELKEVGTPVMQGEYIGNVDDTGASTGHHVHFMVVTEDTKYFSGYGYVWGVAEDITFRDVSINWDEETQGGRPRLAYEAATYGGEGQTYYISGNIPANPPNGGLTQPGNKQLIDTALLTVSGWGEDDEGVTKMEILARDAEAWFTIGEEQTDNPFTTQIDLCEAGISDGPLQVALRVWDVEGNPSMPLSIRNLVVDAPCAPDPMPTCVPGSSQVALFSGPNFTGACMVLGLGSYPNGDALEPLGENQIASFMLGANVQLNLFSQSQYTGRSETFTEDDRHLIDNVIGAGAVSSLRVRSRALYPDQPVLAPVLGAEGGSPTSLDSLILTWSGMGATKYYAELYQDAVGGPLLGTRYWDEDPFWSVGSLPAGTYAWRVLGRIAVPRGTTYDTYYSTWATDTFTVSSANFPTGDMLPVPFFEVFDFGQGDWQASGPWQARIDPSGGLFWGTGDGAVYVGNGAFTSPLIQVESAEALTLRFDYRYEAESPARFWDQRRLQISIEEGPFQDLLQFHDDTPRKDLVSSYINLTPYIGQDFRLRWFFDALDDWGNQGAGWVVDNIRLDFSTPPADSDSDDTFSGARFLADGTTLNGVVDHPGDIDFYRFEAQEGDLIILDVDAEALSPSSPLDTVLTLYPGGDDWPPILENNDENSQTTDSRITYVAPETGWYYARVRANGHPGVGGTNFAYAISLTLTDGQPDTTEPVVNLTTPGANGALPSTGWVSAEASDGTGSGVYSVAFWFHSRDWTGDEWVLLGRDYYGGDGWQAPLQTSNMPEGSGYGLVALATDMAGNVGVDVTWQALVDHTPPWLNLEPLLNPSRNNQLTLRWSAGDSASAISHFTLQIKINDGTWTTLAPTLDAGTTSFTYQAADAQLLMFRLTATDLSGNTIMTQTFTTTAGYPNNYGLPIIYR